MPTKSDQPSLADNRRVPLAQALSRLAEARGKRFATVFEHGSLLTDITRPLPQAVLT